jgi:hypothetical protein
MDQIARPNSIKWFENISIGRAFFATILTPLVNNKVEASSTVEIVLIIAFNLGLALLITRRGSARWRTIYTVLFAIGCVLTAIGAYLYPELLPAGKSALVTAVIWAADIFSFWLIWTPSASVWIHEMTTARKSGSQLSS